jgi:hypothetical protein
LTATTNHNPVGRVVRADPSLERRFPWDQPTIFDKACNLLRAADDQEETCASVALRSKVLLVAYRWEEENQADAQITLAILALIFSRRTKCLPSPTPARSRNGI